VKPLPQTLAAILLVLAFGNFSRADEELYHRTVQSTVMILDPDREVTGSGALIDLQQRLVITNYHVVGKTRHVAVLFPVFGRDNRVVAERSAYFDNLESLREEGRLVKGTVVARDAKRDLAVIQLDRLPAGARSLPLASESPKPGQRVHSIGNPGASDALWVYTQGVVRQVYFRRFVIDEELHVAARVVETQSPINPGDSGGPVVNDRGECVAIVESIRLARQNKPVHLMATFIDVSEIRALLDTYLATIPSHPSDLSMSR
jgi:S1-C subfamily serine protease